MDKHKKYVGAHLRAVGIADTIRSFAERGELVDAGWAREMCQHIDIMDEVVRGNIAQNMVHLND